MEKIVSLLRRAPALGREEFRARYVAELGGLLARAGAPRRCIASFVDVPPEEAGLDPRTTPLPPHDAVVETWWDAPDDRAPLERLHAGASGLISQVFSYRVREVVQKDCARTWPAGQRSPGIKGIYAVTRSPGLTPAEFERHWREVHGPLALRHHVGMSKYVQDVVVEPLEPGAPAFDGFSELHFPTARDMRERFVDSPEGGRRIAQDVAKFVGDAIRLDASEYVLR
jgi:uncharacterized protein (TIGR02118 family)